MKTKHLPGILLIFFCTVCLISCDEDNTEPLSLYDVENHTIYLTYGTKGGVTIVGGNRDYSFTCQSPIVKGEMTHSNYILFEPLGVGKTTCLIEDKTGNTYVLNIHVNYATTSMSVYKTNALISGKGLSENQQNALKEKALATIPVKAAGGYLFVHTEKTDLNKTEPNQNKLKGIVYIYPEKIGENPVHATFERVLLKDGNDLFLNYEYTLKSEDETWHYVFKIVPKSKTSVSSQTKEEYVLIEDLKTKFVSDYAAADSAATYQYIELF